MKPDWHKLMDEYKDSKTIFIADVDFTASGTKLCNKVVSVATRTTSRTTRLDTH
jgi:hypothetical protein